MQGLFQLLFALMMLIVGVMVTFVLCTYLFVCGFNTPETCGRAHGLVPANEARVITP